MAYHYQNYNRHHYSNNRQPQRKSFVEDRDSAFFLGKLNKHHDREHIYNQLKKLTKHLNFYIAKFDMPNGPNGRGNKGFAFVHTKTKEQARRIIALKHLRLGNQECEVKSYDGRTDGESSGRETPDSGVVNRPTHTQNPLNNEAWKQDSWSVDMRSKQDNDSLDARSRINSGMRSESGRFSEAGKHFSRNISESDSNEERKFEKINSESNNIHSDLSHHQTNQANIQTTDIIINADVVEDTRPQNNYDPVSVNSVNTSQIQPPIADSIFHDQWLEEKTRFVLSQVQPTGFGSFMANCNEYMRMLGDLDTTGVAEVQALMNGVIPV